MSFPLIVDGSSYQYPSQGDKANTGWGGQTGNWASAVTSALTKLGLGGTLSPLANAVIDISSTSKGILIPRITTVQRNTITSPPNSLLIFNTTDKVLQYYDSSVNQWISVGARLPDNAIFSGTLTVNGNIIGLASVTITGGISSATADFTDATDATNADTAPLKTLGGMAVKKKLFVGTDVNVGGILNVTGDTNLTGKALTGDGVVGTPSHSFISDPDSGLYRIANNRIGFSANGIRQGEFGDGYGGFIGNIIQVINSTNSHSQSTTNNANWNTDVLSAIGVPWEISITPKYVNSKIKIQLLLNVSITTAGSSYFGISIWRKIGAGTYTQIQIPQVDANGAYEFGIGVGGGSSTTMYLNSSKLFIDSPNSTGLVTYKFSIRTYTSSTNLTTNVPGTVSLGKSYCTIEEVQQ